MRAVAFLLALVSFTASAAEVPLASFADLRADPVPPALVRDTHYWVSNEERLDLFHDAIQDKGGIYVGVGTDQNYLLAAWARSDILILMDFDQGVVDLHRVYRALFRAAPTPAEFLRLWKWESRDEVRRLVSESTPDAAQRTRTLRVYARARWAVERRLQRMMEQMARASRPCFLIDASQYEHLRRLYREDKVFLLRGDLTARRGVSSLGQAVRQAGLEVKVLYLSNAEQYFPYSAQYRRNMRELPMGPDGLVLRTHGLRGLPRAKGGFYHYNTQTAASFTAWLGDAKTRDAKAMLRFAPRGELLGFSSLELGPAEARAAARRQGVGARPRKPKGAVKAKRAETTR